MAHSTEAPTMRKRLHLVALILFEFVTRKVRFCVCFSRRVILLWRVLTLLTVVGFSRVAGWNKLASRRASSVSAFAG
jgi:hypothetical protein